MKKKLVVLLITVASTMMPNLASAIAIDVEGDLYWHKVIQQWAWLDLLEGELIPLVD